MKFDFNQHINEGFDFDDFIDNDIDFGDAITLDKYLRNDSLYDDPELDYNPEPEIAEMLSNPYNMKKALLDLAKFDSLYKLIEVGDSSITYSVEFTIGTYYDEVMTAIKNENLDICTECLALLMACDENYFGWSIEMYGEFDYEYEPDDPEVGYWGGTRITDYDLLGVRIYRESVKEPIYDQSYMEYDKKRRQNVVLSDIKAEHDALYPLYERICQDYDEEMAKYAEDCD